MKYYNDTCTLLSTIWHVVFLQWDTFSFLFTQVEGLNASSSTVYSTSITERVCVFFFSCLTEQKELVFPSGVPLVPAELPLNLIVDPASLFGLWAEAASTHGAQSHYSWITLSIPRHRHTHNVGYTGEQIPEYHKVNIF